MLGLFIICVKNYSVILVRDISLANLKLTQNIMLWHSIISTSSTETRRNSLLRFKPGISVLEPYTKHLYDCP